MTTNDLVEEIESFVVHALTRVQETGDEQYSKGDTQQFEQMNIDELFVWAEEELADLVNYSVMIAVRLRRVRGAVADKIKEVADAASEA